MRILLTQRELIQRGGSELVTVEVAMELGDRGHEVAVFCPRPGDLARIMYSSGVLVKSRLGEIPWTPDIIHGQHHLPAIAALSYFPGTPAIYHCHGVSPWVEQPPIHPRIRKYVVVCQWMVPRFEPDYAIPADQVAVVPNFVNFKRFSERRPRPERRRRALLFGNSGLSTRELVKLREACADEGMALDTIGSAYDNRQSRPELFLPGYDVVFAIGKCALEALACGCAVIPVLPGQAGQLITSANFDEWAFSNFSPRYFTSAAQIKRRWLHREMKSFAAEDLAKVAEKVRREYDLKGAVDRLEGIYAEAVGDARPEGKAGPSEYAAYLEKIAQEADAIWAERQRLRREAGGHAAATANVVALRELRRQVGALQRENDALRKKKDGSPIHGATAAWLVRAKRWRKRAMARVYRTVGGRVEHKPRPAAPASEAASSKEPQS